MDGSKHMLAQCLPGARSVLRVFDGARAQVLESKHMLVLADSSFNEILNFLDAIEVHGKNIKTVIDPLEELDEKKTVAYEGKLLKRMFLKLREWSNLDS